jgi:hypothetical protein
MKDYGLGIDDGTMTINNKHITPSSLITLTFDSDPNIIYNLCIYSR